MNIHIRHIICLFVSLVLGVASSGCDALYRFLDKEGAEEKALIGAVIPHEKNDTIAEVQELLHLYGYHVGKIDGILGLRTRNAVEKFQQDNGLEPTRFVDQATWKKLSIFKTNGLVVDRKINVRFVQTLLNEAGFKLGNIDGKMGPRTKLAVRQFQKAQGLKVDGKIGYRTLNKLNAFIPKRGQSQSLEISSD